MTASLTVFPPTYVFFSVGPNIGALTAGLAVPEFADVFFSLESRMQPWPWGSPSLNSPTKFAPSGRERGFSTVSLAISEFCEVFWLDGPSIGALTAIFSISELAEAIGFAVFEFANVFNSIRKR